MEKYVYIGLTLALTLYAQLIVKARALVFAPSATSTGKLAYLWAMYTDVGVLSGFVAGALASVFWTLALEKTPLTVAFPFLALTFVLTPTAAHFLLGDRLTGFQLVSIGLIVAGVILNAMSATPSPS